MEFWIFAAIGLFAVAALLWLLAPDASRQPGASRSDASPGPEVSHRVRMLIPCDEGSLGTLRDLLEEVELADRLRLTMWRELADPGVVATVTVLAVDEEAARRAALESLRLAGLAAASVDAYREGPRQRAALYGGVRRGANTPY